MVRGESVDLKGVLGASGEDGGVAQGADLLAFTEAVMANDADAIATARAHLEAGIGADGVVDTAAVIAMFNIVDRVADATGIPIDEGTKEFRYDVGAELGMDDLTPEARSAR